MKCPSSAKSQRSPITRRGNSIMLKESGKEQIVLNSLWQSTYGKACTRSLEQFTLIQNHFNLC